MYMLIPYARVFALLSLLLYFVTVTKVKIEMIEELKFRDEAQKQD